MISRKEFLTMAGMASIAAVLPTGSVSAALANNENLAPLDKTSNPLLRAPLKHMLGLGGVAIGNGMNINSDRECYDAMEAAWNLGVRYYDTSPWYGYGLSERRFGHFLFNQKREDYFLSTKVGRLLYGDRNYKIPNGSPWKGKSYLNYEYDFSASGVRRSIEDSLNRMGLSYIDYVFVHDLDGENSEINWLERFNECKKGAFPELIRMREEGIIRGWGLGVNRIDPILKTIDESDPDIFLSAQQYSLLEHGDAVKRLFPAALKRNIQIVLGGVLNTGFLAGTPRYKYLESEVTPELIKKRNQLEAIALKHNVDLRTAALQFAYAPKAVTSVAVGAHTKEQIIENINSLSITIPESFWKELKEKNLIIQEAETKVRKISI
ncbi:MAG: aldo/keto reductase [Capnocytophaga sp.]|nr:aldo/keto reductase [Capnocytophaga sp.]